MARILISALAAVLIHGAVLVFLPFPATIPGTVSQKDHGIAIQITHLSPEPEKKTDPAPQPDMPPVPAQSEKKPPPSEITARESLMPKKEDLSLSPAEPEIPAPLHPDPEPDVSPPDTAAQKAQQPTDRDLPGTSDAVAPSSGMTASTAKDPDTPDRRKKAVPLYKENPLPRYPGTAQRRGHTGTVMLMVFVNETGRAEKLRILESSGYVSLDRAAEKTVAAWRFEPGTSDGVPTGMWVKIPVVFELKH